MSDSSRSGDSERKTKQMINFIVGSEEFAMDLQHVQEVLSCPEITKLPRTPNYVQGVIDLRGEIIPIIDMRIKLGLRRTERTPYTSIIIVETNGKQVGAIVDKINQVLSLYEDQIIPPEKLAGGLSEKYVRGMGKLEERLIVILDMSKILTPEEVTELNIIDNSLEEMQ